MRTAVIILGHGSRRDGADAPLTELAARLRSSGRHTVVEQAFLQYVPPTLADRVEKCVAAGAERIVIVPFFVQPGAHVTKDIPSKVADLRGRYPSVLFSITGHVGGHPMMAEIVEDLVENSAECGVK